MMKKAIIIGAGPAGLTAAYELLKRTDIVPIILEKSGEIGGISKTVNYKGNRMDIGGHRFFSKSDRVMQWWLNIMPMQPMEEKEITVTYQRHFKTIKSEDIVSRPGGDTASDKVMLVRKRLSRIYFLRKFFSYPIQISFDTLKKLGLFRTVEIMVSYLWSRLFPRAPEKSLEDFFINRFGVKLYRLFFKDYTEKVWGVACSKISAEWGAQRIKGISIAQALAHAIKSIRPKPSSASDDLSQKQTETSLIERFLYPKYGPGQLWEEVATQVIEMGGEIHLHQDVREIHTTGGAITAIAAIDEKTGQQVTFAGDYFFSTMPVQELIAGMIGAVPAGVREVAEGLQYRDFITVGVLLSKLATEKMLPDTWIYIQERDVKVGRLQIFNNWSPFMVSDPKTVWIGMEYFCNKSDSFWQLTDCEVKEKAIAELAKMGLAGTECVLDSTVLRVEKTYPAYFGTYTRFDEIRRFTDAFANLFLIGRNGMHKYNNSDHSMLTAMVAVDNILAGVETKANIWAVNTEQAYHEEKSAGPEKASDAFHEPAAGLKPSFLDWLWESPAKRAGWLVGFSLILLQFILFKIRYPFANYMPDSYSYLEAAASNADVSMWPVAYSKFLRLISVFTHSDKVVVTAQYLFMQLSAFTFLFSLFYFLRPARVIRVILIPFFLFDPAILYMSNYISADSLFIGFSFLWLSSLLWIVFQPRTWNVIVQSLLLLACFTLRYNAVYYPFVAALAFFICKSKWHWKLSGIMLGAVMVTSSILFTSNKMKEITGQREFSAFGGWQLANNALYMYQNIPAKDRRPVPGRFVKLEAMVRQHMDTLRRVKLTREDTIASRFYLWSPKGPLIQYMARQWKKDSTTPYFNRWASEAPLYMEYGWYLIREYPLAFAKSVLLPNAYRYALPPAEFLEIYNMGEDSVGPLAKIWFNYKSQRIGNQTRQNAKIMVMDWYPVLATLINVLYLISLLGMLLFQLLKREGPTTTKTFVLISSIWLLNAAFSIFASPITLRYQLFPIIITCSLGVLSIEKIWSYIKIELKKANA